jgi:Uma2 family endonuclease
MEPEELTQKPRITRVSQLDPDATYTYADYLSWNIRERVELLWGKILLMAPAPTFFHQAIASFTNNRLYNALNQTGCLVVNGPEVKLPVNAEGKQSVLQPDIAVFCGNDISFSGQTAPVLPTLIVEILSPKTANRDVTFKYKAYQEAAIPEYWIVRPNERTVEVNTLSNGVYIIAGMARENELIPSKRFPELQLNASSLFNR